jgi:maltose-binding protein MalE
LGISRKSENIEDAWTYIKYMTARNIMKDAALAGEIITRQSAYEDPLVAKSNPAVGIYRDSLDQSKFRPRAASYAAIEKAIGDGVARALNGEASPSDALSQAAQAVIDAQRRA